jgi:hypothetical protein
VLETVSQETNSRRESLTSLLYFYAQYSQQPYTSSKVSKPTVYQRWVCVRTYLYAGIPRIFLPHCTYVVHEEVGVCGGGGPVRAVIQNDEIMKSSGVRDSLLLAIFLHWVRGRLSTYLNFLLQPTDYWRYFIMEITAIFPGIFFCRFKGTVSAVWGRQEVVLIKEPNIEEVLLVVY